MIDRSHPAANALLALLSEQITPDLVPPELWTAVIQLAMERDLGPMLLWVIKQADSEPVLGPLLDLLRHETRNATLQYVQQKNAQVQVDAALRAEGILPLWLKGVTLAATVYPQPALRKMVDLDVLIPQNQIGDAYTILEGLGYSLLDHDRFDLLNQLAHDYHFVSNTSHVVHLELHFRLLGPDGLTLLPSDRLAWFWDQREEIAVDGMHFTTLKPEAHFLYLCAHALLQHGEASIGLKHIYDLHLLARSRDLDWDMIITQAAAFRWAYAIERALALTVDRFATPIPDTVFERLRAARLPDENVAKVERLRSLNLLEGERLLIRFGQLSLRDRIELIRLVLFLPRDRMRSVYQIPPGRPVLPYYLWRWLLMITKAVRTVARRLGSVGKCR